MESPGDGPTGDGSTGSGSPGDGPTGDAPTGRPLERAARGGICARCRYADAVVSARGSAFLRCRHPDIPKYPPQPLRSCAGFRPRSRAPADEPT
jgi:hypothetical protein